MSSLLRGQVVWFDLGDIGRKPGLVVSNNVRNRQLRSALVARVTTSAKPTLQSIVELSHADNFAGRVLCDDLIEIYAEEIHGVAATLTPATMAKVDLALMHALGIQQPR